MPTTNDSRLRSRARRMGLALHRSRSAPSVDNLGGYMVTDPTTNTVVAGPRFELTEEDVQRLLDEAI